MLTAILLISITLQILAAIKALSLIRSTKIRVAWVLFAIALCLMAFRRILPLYLTVGKAYSTSSLLMEVAGMVLSGCMLVAVHGLGRIVQERWDTGHRLEAMLEEKKLLLREVHHRIKNNLSTTISIINLQKGEIDNQQAIQVLEEATERLHGMMMLYERIYYNRDYRSMRLDEYLQELLEAIISNFGSREKIQLKFSLDPIKLSVHQTFLIGIFINEAVTNAMKYAFQPELPGILEVSARHAAGKVSLKIVDNGPGFPADQRKKNGLGFTLMEGLASQLDGALQFSNQPGACIEIVFEPELLDAD